MLALGNAPADPEGQLVCFKTALSRTGGGGFTPSPVAVADQFGAGTMNALRAETLCVPGYVLLPQ